ncbi:MAG: PAS domain S-box protein [Bacteroidetes bacterium]|nr:MAG: PAS domain S-box protein [Bacteroidota bacterium]
MKKFLNKILPRLGIQGKLNFLFILLSTIPLSLVSIYIIQKQIDLQKDEALRSVKNEVNEIKAKTNLLLSRIKQEMMMLAKTSEAKLLIEDLHSQNPLKQVDKEKFEAEFVSLLKENGLYFRVEFLNSIGKKITSVFFENGKSYIMPGEKLPRIPVYFYANAVKGLLKGDIVLSPSEIKLPFSGKIIPSIDCIVPLFNDKSEIVAILIASIHAEKFFETFSLTRADTSVKVIMVNGEGFYLYHSQKKKDWNRLLAERNEENLFHDYNQRVADSILAGTTGSITDDPESIIEYASIFSLGESKANSYIIFTEIPRDVFFASVNQLRTFLILLVLAVAAFSLLSGYFTSRHFIKPINQLVQGTRIIREGNLDYKLDIKTSDEINDLVESFNQMVVHWKDKRELEEQQHLEEAIRERKRYLENIMDSSLDLLMTLTSEGALSFANKRLEDALGYKLDEVYGKYYYDFFPEQYHPFLKNKWDEARQTNGVVYDAKVIKADGDVIDCLISMSRLQGMNECLVIIKDITERKHAEEAILLAKERAEEANRLKTNILANMGHELRTPMIGILGFSKVLVDIKDMNELREVSDLIYQSSQRLMSTLNQILDISKIESGEFKPQPVELDLIEVGTLILGNYRKMAEEKGLKMVLQSSYNELTVISDLAAVQSILNNLVDNAIKFTYKGSITVNFDTKKNNETDLALIEVRDTGIGISEENLNTIFEAFRQGSEGLTRSHEGTGLGLTLIKKYIDILGGEINVESKPNEGSIFTVAIPTNK